MSVYSSDDFDAPLKIFTAAIREMQLQGEEVAAVARNEEPIVHVEFLNSFRCWDLMDTLASDSRISHFRMSWSSELVVAWDRELHEDPNAVDRTAIRLDLVKQAIDFTPEIGLRLIDYLLDSRKRNREYRVVWVTTTAAVNSLDCTKLSISLNRALAVNKPPCNASIALTYILPTGILLRKPTFFDSGIRHSAFRLQNGPDKWGLTQPLALHSVPALPEAVHDAVSADDVINPEILLVEHIYE